MKRKVILIGLDGATYKIIEPLVSKGKLPNISKIMKEGVYGVLNSTIPSLTSPAIISLVTGKNPGKHGIYDFVDEQGKIITLNDIPHKKLWNFLDKENKKSCIMNVRIIYPAEKINGIMLAGNLFSPKNEVSVYPPNLIKEVREFHPQEDFFESLKLMARKGHEKGIINKLGNLTKRRFEIFGKLIRKYYFDFMFLWLDEPDMLQHYFWQKKSILYNYYEILDSMLGDFVKEYVDDETLLFIISDHGFDTSIKYFNLNAWLEKNGYLKVGKNRFEKIVYYFIHEIIDKLPWKYLRKVKNIFDGKVWKEQEKEENTFEYVVDNSKLPGFILRESLAVMQTRWGIKVLVDNHDFRSKLVKELKDKLINIRDEHGKRIIKSVWLKEELYNGPYMKKVPDIIIQTSDGYELNYFLKRRVITKRKRTYGYHTVAREGIFIGWGTDIENGTKLDSIDIVDILPTILHIFQIPIPRDLDGKVLKNIFRENSEIYKRDVIYESIRYNDNNQTTIKKTKKIDQEILKRLRDLGYI